MRSHSLLSFKLSGRSFPVNNATKLSDIHSISGIQITRLDILCGKMCNNVCKQEVSVFSNWGKYIEASELNRGKGRNRTI